MASNSFYPDSASDGIWLDKSDPDQFFHTKYVYLGDNDGYDNCCVCLFRDVNIPSGASITDARLRITAAVEDSANSSANVNIYFNAVDTPALPESWAEAMALAKTAAVKWTNIPAWTTGTVYESPDIKAILQAIVDRPGYVQGGSVIVIIENNNSDAGAVRYGFLAEDTEGSPL